MQAPTTSGQQQFGEAQGYGDNDDYYDDYGPEDEYGQESGNGGQAPMFNPMMMNAMQRGGGNSMMGGNPGGMGSGNPMIGNGVDHNVLASMMQQLSMNPQAI